MLKLVVPVKRVLDHNLKVRLRHDGQGVDLAGQKMALNPFDEVALEEAVRLKERGLANQVVAVSCGDRACEETLRHALALGADRAVLIESDASLQPLAVARLLRKLVEQEVPSLVICGKQAIDDDAAQVGPMLAAMLGWPQACFATRIEIEGDCVVATSAIDGGEETLELGMPAVVTAELHLNVPRFASLANVMKARRLPIEILRADSFDLDLVSRLEYVAFGEPLPRPAGQRLASVGALLEELGSKGLLKRGDA